MKGTIGDITFYKSKDGYLARQKGGVEKERFLNDPKFQRTRENAAEFGRAGKASKTLCTAIRPVLNRTQDSRMISRLVQAMMRVIKADRVSNRGLRNVLDGELMLLQGFDFNGNAPLSATLYAPFSASIDRAAGVLEVDIPGFVPDSQVVAPRGTTVRASSVFPFARMVFSSHFLGSMYFFVENSDRFPFNVMRT